MTLLVDEPLPLKTWLATEQQALNERVERAQRQGQELARHLEIKTSDSQGPAGAHDLLKHFIAAEIRMRQLLLSHPAPLIITDQPGKILLTNVAAKHLLAALGYNFNKVQPEYPLLQEVFPDLQDEQEVTLKVAPHYAESGEVILLARETHIEWQESPARILLFHDISIEAQARQKLEAAVSSLEELNLMKSEFMSMATHEFRTPLASIFSSLQLMEQYCQKMAEETPSRWLEKLARHVKRSEDAITHLDGLVQEMLVLEKTQAGRTHLNPYPVVVCDLVQEVVEQISPLAEQLTIPLAFSCQAGLEKSSFNLDAQLLQHILTNLLSNALRFSSAGQAVRVLVQQEEHWLCLEVADQGRGIPAEDLQNLGEPFFRASNVDHVQGTGLGLSIVKRFTELHQGHLQIKSRLGAGSQFQVWLPTTIKIQEEEDD